MKSPIVITFFIFLCSCNSSKVVGKYVDCTKHCYAINKIQLLRDSTFIYNQFYDVGGDSEVRGVWILNNDTLILNTFEQQRDRIIKIDENIIDTDSIIFEFKNDCGIVLINNASIDQNKRIESRISIAKSAIKAVDFQICSDPMLIPIRYNILNPNANYFIIYTRILKSRIFLENQKYLFRRNKLIEIYNTGDSTNTHHILKRQR